MPLPTRISDRKVYAGDPYALRLVFNNPDGSPRDVSTGVWTASLEGLPDAWTVDTTEAAQGIVVMHLSAGTSRLLPARLNRWDLFESVIFNRTVFVGRLEKWTDV